MNGTLPKTSAVTTTRSLRLYRFCWPTATGAVQLVTTERVTWLPHNDLLKLRAMVDYRVSMRRPQEPEDPAQLGSDPPSTGIRNDQHFDASNRAE
jgi:hypothetical protein